ncbi:MAG: SLC13 family permease [Gemmatimonadota bacterium]
MPWHAWLTLAVLAGTVYVLATDRFSPAPTLLGAVILLLVTRVITPAQAFSGFSNPAPITVAALFIFAAAVDKTGALQPIVGAILGGSNGERRVLARIVAPVAGASAFLNNTPIVAMLAPQISAWADRNGLARSRFLMPLSFASILGGMVTLIGTSTNIVVSGLLQAHGQPPLGMFELTPVGLPVALLGLGLIVLLAPVVLPDRRGPRRQVEEETRQFVVTMRVVPGGAVDGRTVEVAGLRRLQGLFLVEVERDGETIAPVTPTTVIHGGDRLTFVGKADHVVDIQRTRGLESTERDHLLVFDDPDHTFFEAVVGEASPLVGRTLKEAEFRGRYQAAVVAIHRAGERVNAKLGEVPLRVGDTLILLADPGFRDRWRDRNDFLLVSTLGGAPPMASRKALWVGLIGAGIVVTTATGLMPILDASLLAVLALLLLRVLSPREARAAVDLDVIIVIAAAFGLGAAIEASGLGHSIARLLLDVFGGFGNAGALFAVVLATVLMTVVITNNAVAVLMFPIALSVAQDIGAEPRLFAIALAIAASASFLTPIGYQTNTMVYGAGGYRFRDYARLGAPVSVLVTVGVVLVVRLGLAT